MRLSLYMALLPLRGHMCLFPLWGISLCADHKPHYDIKVRQGCGLSPRHGPGLMTCVCVCFQCGGSRHGVTRGCVWGGPWPVHTWWPDLFRGSEGRGCKCVCDGERDQCPRLRSLDCHAHRHATAKYVGFFVSLSLYRENQSLLPDGCRMLNNK